MILNEDNPTEVKEWIPTGSRWLDSITCRGTMAGIPVGKDSTELAGLSSAGKVLHGMPNCLHKHKRKDIVVVYFDAESAIDPNVLEQTLELILTMISLYIQAVSVEKVPRNN